MKPFLSVVMKPTLSCNAHCRHCYSHDDGSGVMDMSVVERTVGMVRVEYDSARYLWTGGEPLLAGERFFKRARACQKEAYGKAIGRCGNTIQTNGLLLTPRFLEFCRDARINVGVSFEGGCDAGLRPGIDRAKVESVLSMMSKKGHMFSVISSIHSGNVGSMHEMYRFFRDRGIAFYCSPALRMIGCPESGLWMSPQEYAEACIALFDEWLTDASTPIPVLPFYQYLRASLSEPNISDCAHASCLTRWISVEPNGDVYPCSKPCPPEYRMGNIMDVDSIYELFSSDGFRRVLVGSIERRERCRSCPIFTQCAGGCSIDAAAEGGIGESGFFSCESYRIIFPHIRDSVADIIDGRKDLSSYNRFVRDAVVGKLTNPNVVTPY